MYIVHCIVKWTICTLYVVQIVQSIIYPCPCTLNKYSLSMYNVQCTFYNVPCVKCKIFTHYRLYTLQVVYTTGTYMKKFKITQLLWGDSCFPSDAHSPGSPLSHAAHSSIIHYILGHRSQFRSKFLGGIFVGESFLYTFPYFKKVIM